MLLRASGATTGSELDLAAVTDDAAAAGSGIAHAEVLLAFAEAAVRGSDDVLGTARAALLDELGSECLVDAAAVVSNFERMVRIADSTGIPLDAPVTAMTVELRDALGIDEFASAVNTPPAGRLARVLGRILGPVVPRALRVLGPGRSGGR